MYDARRRIPLYKKAGNLRMEIALILQQTYRVTKNRPDFRNRAVSESSDDYRSAT